ncbi:hypothetical protein BCU68_12065 [Vibrio sp. 10N.286.49.B3]|nr:hypothetical protein BCU68_12065 [Vibrio sp. 10N.286.49.B3]
MNKCNSHCKNYNIETGTCQLVDDCSHMELEALMNAPPEVLARFLLQNDCDGDFLSMYQTQNKINVLTLL